MSTGVDSEWPLPTHGEPAVSAKNAKQEKICNERGYMSYVIAPGKYSPPILHLTEGDFPAKKLKAYKTGIFSKHERRDAFVKIMEAGLWTSPKIVAIFYRKLEAMLKT